MKTLGFFIFLCFLSTLNVSYAEGEDSILQLRNYFTHETRRSALVEVLQCTEADSHLAANCTDALALLHGRVKGDIILGDSIDSIPLQALLELLEDLEEVGDGSLEFLQEIHLFRARLLSISGGQEHIIKQELKKAKELSDQQKVRTRISRSQLLLNAARLSESIDDIESADLYYLSLVETRWVDLLRHDLSAHSLMRANYKLAIRGLIRCRKGDLRKLQEIVIFEPLKDELQPLLDAAILHARLHH